MSGKFGKCIWEILKLSLGMGYNVFQGAYLDQLCINQLIKVANMLYFSFIYAQNLNFDRKNPKTVVYPPPTITGRRVHCLLSPSSVLHVEPEDVNIRYIEPKAALHVEPEAVNIRYIEPKADLHVEPEAV